MFKIFEKLKSNKKEILFSAVVSSPVLSSIVAHADTTSSSTGLADAQTAVVGSLSSGKAEVITFLIAVLGVGISIYLLKFGVKQGINFFGFIANKK